MESPATHPPPPGIDAGRRDVFVLGLRRSGIHAIVSWLIPHFTGLVRVMNDATFDPNGTADPLEDGIPVLYYHCHQGRAIEVMPLRRQQQRLAHANRDVTLAFSKTRNRMLRPLWRTMTRRFMAWTAEQRMFKEFIPYGPDEPDLPVQVNLFVIENMTPADFFARYPIWAERRYRPWLARIGAAEPVRRDVVQVVREPWNQLASVLKNPPLTDPRPVPPEDFLRAWLDFTLGALDAAGPAAKHGFAPPMMVRFSEWAASPAYREGLSRELELVPNDSGREVVSGFWGGSSFEKKQAHGNASKMQVGSRWRAYADHPLMRKLLEDAQTRRLAEDVLGESMPDE